MKKRTSKMSLNFSKPYLELRKIIGYLALSLPELTSKRLEGARLLISIAPARPFSRRECAAVRKFVEGGGIFISTTGNDRAGPSRELLKN